MTTTVPRMPLAHHMTFRNRVLFSAKAYARCTVSKAGRMSPGRDGPGLPYDQRRGSALAQSAERDQMGTFSFNLAARTLSCAPSDTSDMSTFSSFML